MRTPLIASSLTPLEFRIAEKGEDGVADIFVDGGAVFERDLRHLGEIAVEQVGELFGLKIVRRGGEIGDVGEEDGELLAVGRDLHALRAGEDGVVDLRREVFRQLGRERLELLVLLGDDLGGGIELPLVAVAEAHQPARHAEQLLVALQQLLVMLLVLVTAKAAIGDQLLARGDDLLFASE
jgi:hypothetical protein